MQHNLEKKISDYITNIPSLPTSITKVLELCNNMNVNPADLNHVISLDPVLVGRVLKHMNSAYYGISTHITSVAKAIIMLGINTIKNITLSTAVLANLSVNKNRKGLDMEGFWRHSLCVGVTAKLLAKKQGIDKSLLEDYFTAGLLHDIGKIPLNAVLSKEYLEIIGRADAEKAALFTEENKALNLNHSLAGTMIADAWKLQGPVADVIRYHHNINEYTGEYKNVINIVIAANYFACLNAIGFSGDHSPNKPETELQYSEEILTTVEDEIKKAKIFLHIE
jgi:putative nucleotidyltransferase with HDIG domain